MAEANKQGSTSKLKTVRIPLVGSYNERDVDGTGTLVVSKDQRFLNCLFEVYEDPVTGNKEIYCSKRPGWEQDSLVDADEASTGLIKPLSFNAVLSAFGSVNSIIYLGTVNVGAITGLANYFSETIIGTTTYVLIRSSDGTGWYFAENAAEQTAYTGDTTNLSAVVNNIPSTTGMYSGQAISGTNIPASTRILTVDSATQITMNANATGTSAGVAITKTPIAKILDADFVTTGEFVSAIEEMNGYLYYVSGNNIYNSDLNSVTAWGSTRFLAANMAPDPPRAISRLRDKIIVFGGSTKESFSDVGNQTGSPLERWAQDFERIGALDQRSVVKLENDVYFVSAPQYGDIGVFQLSPRGVSKVSPSWVDKIMGTVSATSATIYASAFRLGGQPYAAFALSTASEQDNLLLLESGEKLLLESGDDIIMEGSAASVSSFSRFLVYNVDLKHWSEWDTSKATFITGSVTDSGNRLAASSRFSTDGKLYKIDSTNPVYSDDGTTYTMEIRTSKVDLGTQKRKFIHKIRLVCDKEATGSATISWSDDDYGTFSTARTFDLTKDNPQLISCGSHVGGRVYKIQHTSANPFRARALEIEYSEGIK